MKHTTLADLPPELLDQITAYVPTASCLSNLALTSHALKNYVDQSAWSIFARTHFPSTAPVQSSSWQQTVRTLTSRSRAWDRRAIVARFIEPSAHIHTFPGHKIAEKWRRPSGQTVGFTPRVDACTIDCNHSADKQTDVLAYSAGAQIVLRRQTRSLQHGHRTANNVQWMSYLPLSATEGRDDVTSLHLVPSDDTSRQAAITGTANGDLQHLSIPFGQGDRKIHTYFATQGQPVQSSSISVLDGRPSLLAASLGHSRLALYQIDANKSKSFPISEVDTAPAPVEGDLNNHKNHRIWSTVFLSHDRLALGLGPCAEPIQIFDVLQTGISPTPIRKFQVFDTTKLAKLESDIPQKAIKTSVYPVIPVPGRNELFFSGAYDGLVRLHDLRSHRDAEVIIQDGYDDSAIYSLLLRNQETIIVGTSRHSHLKVFDARMNGKAYSYLDVSGPDPTTRPADDFSLYLSTRASNFSNRWRTDGSIYSLASPGPTSPYMYAGVQNGVIEMASTEILHRHPDPLYFEAWPGGHDKPSAWNGWSAKSILNVARYENGKMNGQKGLWDTWHSRHMSASDSLLDARWKGVKAIDLD